jgi:hypothetical protein
MLRYPARGPWHWRSLDSWWSPAPDPDQALEWLADLEISLGRIGARIASTPGGSVIRAWISHWSPWGSWANPFTIEETEWLRSGYYGGRCQCVRGFHGPATSADVVSAYPWSGGLALPDVLTPQVPWEASRDGMVECTLDLDRLVARVVPVEMEGRISWPTSGEFRGVWPIRTVRAAVESGAELVEVHRSMAWAKGIQVDGGMLQAIYMQGRKAPDHIAQALKRMGRMWHGKLGQDRIRSELYPKEDVRAALDAGGILPDGNELIEVRGYWGESWAWAAVKAPGFPTHVCPIWPAIISARVTIRLARAERIIREKGGSIRYLDTDGIAWTGAPDAIQDSRETLGGWAVDQLDWIEIFGQKMYARSDGKHALGGVPASVHSILLETGSATVRPRSSLGATILQTDKGDRIYTLERSPDGKARRYDPEPEPWPEPWPG